jgi:hypothetical protein
MDSYDVRKAANILILGLYPVCRIVQRREWKRVNLPEAPRSRAMHIQEILSNLIRGHFGFNYYYVSLLLYSMRAFGPSSWCHCGCWDDENVGKWLQTMGWSSRWKVWSHGHDFNLPCLFWSHCHATIRQINTPFDQARWEVSSDALSSSKMRLRLVVDVDNCAILASWCGVQRSTIFALPNIT